MSHNILVIGELDEGSASATTLELLAGASEIASGGNVSVTLLGVGAKSIKFAFGLLKTGFTTMKDAITSMPGLIKGAYSKGKELLGGAFGLLKSGFNSMKTFVMTTVPNALASAYGSSALNFFALRGINISPHFGQ